jgi:hypothetical protein
MIVPEGLRDILSINTNVPAKLCVGTKYNTSSSSCEFPFQGKVRGMVSKMPGFTFSSYKEIAFFPTMLMAED